MQYFNYQSTIPHYHPWFHPGMNLMLLGSAPYYPNAAIPPYPFIPAAAQP